MPIEALVHPLCVIPDSGGDRDIYFVVLPKQLLTLGYPALGFHAVIAQDTYYLKIHVQIHQINIGIWYKNHIYYQAMATKYVLNHGNPGGFLDPIHVYLLRSFFDARRTFMGIKYVPPSL